MSKDQMHYKELVDEALRNVVREVLSRIENSGLPGNHHLYVSFHSHYPGLQVPDHLSQKFPDEITIVLQHQFWDLSVGEHSFEVALSFNGVRELLSVPFGAITGFVDPSVRFGLQFQGDGADEAAPLGGGEDMSGTMEVSDERIDTAPSDSDVTDGEKIVTLDKFRKK
tara:strand:- start:98 stop:601 length:504 start_codon:yes stop_codon:yes gene_type:complete